jgi:hypothetical protein
MALAWKDHQLLKSNHMPLSLDEQAKGRNLMDSHPGVSLDNIAGIVPQVSTYSDVLRLLGSNYDIERIVPHQTKNRMLAAKIVLHFPITKVVVVFLDPGGKLPPEAQVTVVGAEEGSPLQTADGLHVGMFMTDAEKIIVRGYKVRGKSSHGDIEIVSADDKSSNFLWVSQKDDKVVFIGLYRRETNEVPD